MALTQKNQEYLDEFGHGPGRNKDLTDVLGNILSDANITTLKAGMKDKEIARLNTQKINIETKLTELSN